MKTGILFLILPVLGVLYACQSEVPQENSTPKRILTVKATLPGSDKTRGWISYGNPEYNTRAQITYGNPNHSEEIFMWDKEGYGGLKFNDCIALYNVTRLSQCPPEGIQLDVVSFSGRTATFETVKEVDPNVQFKVGDTLFINYWETLARIHADASFDERKIFTIGVGTASNKPQYVFDNPNDSSLAYMQSNLKMYDIVTVEKDDCIPDLHFRPLSAILRVSLRNETSHEIYPTSLRFEYPATASFFNTTLYCSVDAQSKDGSGLKIYEDEEFFGSSIVYADSISTTINGKDGTKDIGGSIAPGKTYDLYLSTVPRIANNRKGNSLFISLVQSHNTNNPYSITLDGFDAIIEAGKRYWFNLTAVEDEDGNRKLMLTNEWLAEHTDAEPYYK